MFHGNTPDVAHTEYERTRPGKGCVVQVKTVVVEVLLNGNPDRDSSVYPRMMFNVPGTGGKVAVRPSQPHGVGEMMRASPTCNPCGLTS